MVIAELALLYVPAVPRHTGIITIVIALVGAVKFTGWYPEHINARRKAMVDVPTTISDSER